MRSATLLLGVPFLVLATGLAACAPAVEEDAEGGEQDLSGGSGTVESPAVLFFEAGADAALPKCAGALIGKKVAVTAKSCAIEGMIVGRGADEDGKGTRGAVTAVHVPEGDDADIAVVELDRELGGTPAVLTHAPLRAGYTISSFAAVDSGGILGIGGVDKGEASSVGGRLTSETELHGTLFPNRNSKICTSDVGAPVCSSTSSKLFGYELRGTCGLSGIVVGPEASAPATTTGANEELACSGDGWKVAQLGRHADFIRRFAPEAFQPIVVDRPILRNYPIVPQGLWGYQTGGEVTSCKIETTSLSPVEIGKDAKVTAKVAFGALEQRSAPFGRFGIAPKSAPTQMRWFPARLVAGPRTSTSLQATFEGVVSSMLEGEYVVGFRASPNGGESWTQCDVDGIDNGFDVAKILELRVATTVTPAPANPPGSEEPNEPPPAETTPQSEPPPASPPSESAEEEAYADDYASYDGDDDYASDGDADDFPVVGTKKKKKSSESCSASPAGTTGAASGLPLVGLLLGLAAVARRRR